MPHQTPLRPGDPRGVGRYRVAGRLVGIPSDDPIYVGTGPDGTEVAISMLRGDWAQDAAARDRFAAEAAVAKRVPPFCAARILDAGLDGTDAYLVSEFVPGPSLLELVTAEGIRRGHDLDAIAIGMATGLASVHQAGLVHGRFGPEHVVLSTVDGSPRVVEFGITPPYGAATPSADMLAWAETVVFAASGRPPASHADLDVLPDYIKEPVAHCLDPDPSERPAARAVVLSLLGGGDIPAGVLAEGSRRATRPVSRPGGFDDFAAGSRHSGSGQYSDRPASGRQPRPNPSRQAEPRETHPRQGQARLPPSRQARSAALQSSAAQSRHTDGRPGRAHNGASHSGRPQPGRSSGRRAGLIAAAAVVLVVAAGVLIVQLIGNSRTTTDRLSSDAGHTVASSEASASAPPSATPGPSTPPGFAGQWSGQVSQPPNSYRVAVQLTAGATIGTVSYTGPALNCSGQLNLVTATSRKLTMTQGIIEGQSRCENGDVTIVLSSTGHSILFSFRSDGYTAAGTLNRG